MDKKRILITIVFLLLALNLSGCIGTNEDAWAEDNVRIVSYSIVTYKSVEEKLDNGFVYNEDAKFYMVNGTAKNIAGKSLSRVLITVKFYDGKNTFLREESSPVANVEKDYTWTFQIIYLSSWDHFEDVDHIEFEISGSESG